MKYISNDLVKIASEQDVFDILVRDGVPMKLSGGIYRHRIHDSLVITPNKGFYWFSRDYGSKNPIDYYKEVENMDFVSAAYKVLEVMNYDFTRKDVVVANETIGNPNYIKESFDLPAKAEDHKKVFAYLTKTRGINPDILNRLIKQGLIYQSDKYSNAVFVGKDYEGNIVSAFKRSTLTINKSGWTRGDEKGSQKEYRFRIENPTNKIVNVFESEIDLLSYLSLQPELARNENYVALGGVSDKAILAFLEHNKQIEQLNICTDNDPAGHHFSMNLAEKIGKDYRITREIPINKDFNEDLKQGIVYERNRIDVMTFDSTTKEMTKKEKIEYINRIFSKKYQGMMIELTYPGHEEIDYTTRDASINTDTKAHFRYRDKIENKKSYQNKLNIGVEKDLPGLLKNCVYQKSKEELKEEQNAIHKATVMWHYFAKPLIIDCDPYSLIVDVRETAMDKLYIHKIRLKEIEFEELHQNKNGALSQIPDAGILTCEKPPFNLDNDIKKDMKSQADSQIFSFSKDEL